MQKTKEQEILKTINEYETGQISHPNKVIYYIKDIINRDQAQVINSEKLEGYLPEIANLFKITVADVKSKSRKFNVVNARRVFYLFCKENKIPKSTTEIARILNQDHASYIFQVKEARKMIETNNFFREKYNKFTEQFGLLTIKTK